MAAIVFAELLVVSCGDRRDRGNPIAPSVAPGPSIQSSAAAAAGNASRGAARSASISLSGEAAFEGTQMVAFPPRNDSFEFRQELERKYRDGLRRTATDTFVDAEGDVVWTQEYLRYRTNGCGHAEAVQRVLQQIDGGPGAPVCADVPGGRVAFPPRNESYAFRQELELKYRDGLRRGTSSTCVDLEGSIVWTQEYLRYRVNACSHGVSVARVFDQIDGRGIGPVCVTGFHVYFGDTGFFMNGRFDGPNRIRGSFQVPVLGHRLFEFEMRR
jgi:hypothetical protein